LLFHILNLCRYAVVLKLEKIYLPCMLVTKKRYVGHAFESPSQVTPIFDAKGIETVRRDNCPAVGKLMVGTYPKRHAQMLAKAPKIPPKYPKSHAQMLAKVRPKSAAKVGLKMYRPVPTPRARRCVCCS
jgi:hypothetical protein